MAKDRGKTPHRPERNKHTGRAGKGPAGNAGRGPFGKKPDTSGYGQGPPEPPEPETKKK